MKEADLHRQLMMAASKLGARLFRNNVGLGWMGREVHNSDGTVILSDARRIRFGLAVGSSDLIGWVPVTVTDEMVGRTLAVFTSTEVKMPKGRISQEQRDWLTAVENAGGIANVCRSVDSLPLALRLPGDSSEMYQGDKDGVS